MEDFPFDLKDHNLANMGIQSTEKLDEEDSQLNDRIKSSNA